VPDVTKQVFIGVMSGTSLDGIDTSLVEFESTFKFTVLETHFTPYSEELRQRINHTAQNNDALFSNEDHELHIDLAPIYANACKELLIKSGFSKSDVVGIANHGQTVKHEPSAPRPYSLQLGDAQILANLSEMTVFSQFRQADLAAGGQGAPLMPAFHSAWLGSSFDRYESVFVLNLGGIANISKLGQPTLGFDTGPGNVLLDQWIEKNHNKQFDINGDWASTGTVNQSLLANLLQDPYFALNYPKSTGTDYFNLDFLYRIEPKLDQFNSADVQSTLVSLTAHSIASEVERFGSIGVIYVCGGGARNSALLNVLDQRLNTYKIETTDTIGLPSDWVEAVGFAWLGYCCHNKINSNMPSVTGAQASVVLGETFHPQ
jgi:anhydro-N-acetylmuramic acid kinase